MKRLTFASLFIILALSLSSCSMHLGLSKILGSGSSSSSTPGAKSTQAASTPASGTVSLTIDKGKFRPKNLTVKVGTALTWTNNDSVSQSVTSDTPGLFDSGPLATGAKWSYTFSQPGTFPYHSTGSKTTFGSVVVTP
jgi:plastocyanin